MKNKTKGLLLQIPAILILVASLIASIYVKLKELYQITWATPLFLAIIIILFFFGRYFENKNSETVNMTKMNNLKLESPL